MTKSELVNAMVSETGLLKKDCEAMLNSFTSNITKSLSEGNDVKLIGFGAFNIKDRASRVGRNPRTGEELQISACKVPGFKAGAELKKSLN